MNASIKANEQSRAMTANESGGKLTRNEAFYTVEMDGNTLLYRPTSQNAVHLDSVASLIWKMCDGTRTAEELAGELAEIYPESANTVKSDVLETVEMLLQSGAISADGA